MGGIIESAEDLLGIDDLETVPVVVKAWKGRVVLLRSPSAFDAIAVGKRIKALTAGSEADGWRIVLSELMVNSKGEKIIKTDEEFNKLYEKSPRALREIHKVADKMLGLADSEEEAKAEAAKGKDASPATAIDSSPTV
jgi:hypothetical protein